ncbi:MAG: uroporphyrinogen-III synthase [Proteobacteria bacterium]|nr:uroporphyrinogen-III synthase [Pseudomonadota bacterium]
MRTLNGRRVLVTRPREQAGMLMRLLRDGGGEPVLFPALEIRAPAQPETLEATMRDLARFDLAIFISPTAVEYGLRFATAAGPWPKELKVAAVGPGGATALAAAGIHNVVVPASRFDSEGLLDKMAKLTYLTYRNVIIFRGGGGRELLATELKRRGAEVTLAECYERSKPATDGAPIVAMWREGRLDAITVTSSEAMDNLVEMLGEPGRELLAVTPVFAPHPRIIERAQWRGALKAQLTAAGDKGIVDGMQSYFAKAARLAK